MVNSSGLEKALSWPEWGNSPIWRNRAQAYGTRGCFGENPQFRILIPGEEPGAGEPLDSSVPVKVPCIWLIR